jgi:hypothetical protein
MLHAGEGSMIASLTCARWHGVTAAQDPRVHVVAPFERHPRSAGFVVVRRTRRVDPAPWHRSPLVLTSRARAVIDAARDAATADQATAIICEAVERRLVQPEALRHELEAGPRGGGGIVRRAVEQIEAGAWSVPECDLHLLVARSHGLPDLWLNPSLSAADGTRLPTPDGWFDDVGLAVPVHSWRWHSSMADWDTTVMTDGVFAEYGITVVGVTPHAIRHAPGDVLARIERAYRAASDRPRPPVVAGIPGGARAGRSA